MSGHGGYGESGKTKMPAVLGGVTVFLLSRGFVDSSANRANKENSAKDSSLGR